MFETYTNIAGLNVKIISEWYAIKKKCEDYCSLSFAKEDILIKVNTIDAEKEKKNKEIPNRNTGYYESICAFRKLSNELPKFNAFVFHASLITVGGKGIVFCAPSGTGKTTHTLLWKELLGENMTIINGDKPIIRFINGKPIAYGSPWKGKEQLGENTSVKLTDVCFLSRSIQNSIMRISDKKDIEKLLARQMTSPKTPNGMFKNAIFINGLAASCKFWKIKCNMNIDAAVTCYNSIFNNTEI